MIELFSRALSWVGRLASIRIVCYGCVALILCLCAQLLVNRTSPSFSETFSSSRTQRISSKLPVCPEKPPGLLGKFSVSNDPKTAPSWLELENSIPHVRHGGYQPEDCVAKQRVAIIVPYRNRDSHLRLLLSVLHPMLRRQQLDYRIFVIEQAGTTRFNRASLLNIGFVEAEKNFKADCYIFHDVDLLPEHDHNIYRCGSQPRHVSPAMDKFGYRFPFIDGFFGVCSLTGKQFRFVNGLSNVFFGWGGEDDDFYRRLGWAGYNVSRYPMSIARYRMIRHNSDYLNDPNPQRVKLVVQGRKRWKKDGINSLKYSVTGVQDRRVVYIVTVDIPVAEILRRSVRTLSYHKTDVFLVCFSVVNDASYHNVRELWIPDIRRNSPRCPIVLVGTQVDLRAASDRPVVTYEMGRRLGCRVKAAKYVECSAMTGENVNTVFQEVILAATNRTSRSNSLCDLL